MRVLAYLLASGLALSGGLMLSRYWQQPQQVTVQEPSPAPVSLQPLLALDGTPRSLSDWDGKILLVNFWATWCGPCREEIPLIQQARAKYRHRNLEVIGIAIDEAQPVMEYRDELAIGYPLLLVPGDPIALLTSFGDDTGALPHSAVVGTSGEILATHTGPLTAGQLEAFILPHL